ncbi:MAG: hypothetical protein OXR84_10435 [Magnetovibrio sp.]|nr:hypothetical protein [Magnetovibrio sp.]MDD9907167.1 hypothetical protein [Rhodospirillaceae bacterium]
MTRHILHAAIAATVMFTAGVGVTPLGPNTAQAATKCPAPKGAAISKYGKFLDASKLAGLIAEKSVQDQIRKIPFIGKPVVDGFFKKLPSLEYKDSKKFGKYLEYTSGKHTMTVFNIGDYAGSARWIVAYSYNGDLKTPGSGGSGLWKCDLP